MVVSTVLLDAKGACSGKAEVAFGGSAGTVFTVSNYAVFLLGVEDGLKRGFRIAFEILEFQSGILGRFESFNQSAGKGLA